MELSKDRFTPGPRYGSRITDPSKLTNRAVLRLYRLNNNDMWEHTDYIVLGTPFKHAGHLRVSLSRVRGNERETLILADMGIVPAQGRKLNPRAYTVLL